MDINEILEDFINGGEDNAEIEKSLRHNFKYFYNIHVSRKLCNEYKLSFDARKDYWHRPEVCFLISYIDKNFYGKFSPAEDLRRCFLELALCIRDLRPNKELDNYTNNIWSNKPKISKTDFRKLSYSLADLVEKSILKESDKNIITRHAKIFEREKSIQSHFASFIREIGDTGEPKGLIVAFARRIRLFGYLTANNHDEFFNHSTFFGAWYSMMTSTNSYDHGGAQSLGPSMGNNSTDLYIDHVDQWFSGKTLKETGLNATWKRSQEIKDISSYTPITELYGFVRLGDVPIINKAVVKSYAEHFNQKTIDIFELQKLLSQEIREIIGSNKQMLDSLLSVWNSIRKETKEHVQNKLIFEHAASKKWKKNNKGYLDLKKFVNDRYQECFENLNLNYSDLQKAMAVAHLIIDFKNRNDIPEAIEIEDQEENEENETTTDAPPVSNKVMKHSLNQIFYGPPGTGKTLNAMIRAVEICTDKKLDGDIVALEKEIERLRHNKQLSFVTFHQSYGYEEFVEGIKPVQGKNEGDALKFEVVDGIFKDICVNAGRENKARDDFSGAVDAKRIWKMSLGNTLSSDENSIYDYCIKKNCLLLGWGDDLDFSSCKTRDEIWEKAKSRHPEISKTDYTISAVDRLKNGMNKGDLVVISHGNLKFRAIGEITGEYEYNTEGEFFQRRNVKWLVVLDKSLPYDLIIEKQFSQQAIYNLHGAKPNTEAVTELISQKNENRQNYVLVIDEINRGNVSKILGELITLLEEDKRKGSKYPMEVILPYSKEPFQIPSNVHIIGTMNTADRSISFLDTALRRRFQFKEFLPSPEVVKNNNPVINSVDKSAILELINKRIEFLYDRDHTIGHSYFLGIENLCQLRDSFINKIIPLLSEYFYNDWKRIAMILGSPTSEDSASKSNYPIIVFSEQNPKNIFGFESEFDQKPIYKISEEFKLATEDELKPFFKSLEGSIQRLPQNEATGS